MCREPLDQAGRQAVVRQVGERRGEPGAGDRGMARVIRVQPAQGTQRTVLEIGGILRQDAHGSSGPDRKIDQRPDLASAASAGSISPLLRPASAQAALVPGRKPQERQRRPQAVDRVGREQAAEAFDRGMVAAPQAPRRWLQHTAPSEGRGWALLAQHEGLAMDRDDRLGDEELSELGLARFRFVCFKERQDRRDLGRTQMKLVAPAMFERAYRLGRGRELHRKNARRRQISGRGHLLAAANFRVMNARQVDRRARASADPPDRPIVPMQAAHANDPAVGLPLQLIPHRDAPRRDRARHDRPVAGNRERTVDRHPEDARVVARSDRRTQDLKSVFELIEPLTGRRRRSHDRRGCKKRSADQATGVFLHQVEPRGVGQVALREHNQPPGEPEQAKDLEVFARLGHDRVVGRHDQHGQVEPGGTGQHVANESLVARHVDDGEMNVVQIERGEAQVDRDSALFFGG